MNCKPQDLAVIVKAEATPTLIGKIVTALHLAPRGVFRLPDGKLHNVLPAEMAPWWVCEFAQPVRAPLESGGWRSTAYAPVPDQFLRPIRDPGDDATDQMVLIAGLPQEVVA